jgi:hypothetical protein
MGKVRSADEAARGALAPGNRRRAAGLPDATNGSGIEGRTVRSRLGRSSAEVARRGAFGGFGPVTEHPEEHLSTVRTGRCQNQKSWRRLLRIN